MPEPALTKRVHRVKACIALKTLIMPMALPLGVVAAMGEMADRSYDKSLLAQAEASIPVQVVVITGQRLQG